MNNQISLNRMIFPMDVILKAINNYRDICSITPRVMENYVICTINYQEDEISLIRDEFCNYLIALINSKGNLND
ncbi:HxsD-like protein [Tissierella sp.]|uniref:HxsD-like protein n=1 Tax=Tissierella sp. TaxID=41274 RepID=UPI0028B11EC4|nr:HxsD-like protein [Tissierella sp.]